MATKIIENTSQIVPRWEWRAFDDNYLAFKGLFENFKPFLQKKSEEIYFLIPNLDINVKIRYQLLDVKHRLGVDERGLEQWVPLAKYELPLNQVAFNELSKLLGFSHRNNDWPLSEVDFISSLPREANISTVSIKKVRNRYEINDVLGEFTQIWIERRKTYTIAFEHENPQKINEIRRLMGIENVPNENYPEALKRLFSYTKEPLHGN